MASVVEIVIKATDKASDALRQTGLTFTELKAKLDLARQGFETFTGVFKQAMEIGNQGRNDVAKCVEKKGADQQAAAIDPVGEIGQRRRLDAEQGAAVGDQGADRRRIHGKCLAQVVHQSRRGQHAGANGKVAGQQSPERR